LMQLIIEYAKSEGLKRISGQVLQENSAMLNMCRELGFALKSNAADHTLCDVTLELGTTWKQVETTAVESP
jgi:acetyltransferase